MIDNIVDETNVGVIHFTKCSPTSTIASARIARFIQEELENSRIPVSLIDTKEKADLCIRERFDVLFVVNGPFGFCDWREECVGIVKKADYIIYVQNDYAIKPPSQFKKAGIKFDEIYTTCKGEGRYINWNQLTYNKDLINAKGKGLHSIDGLLYYGAFREGREAYFKTYFDTYMYRTNISTTPKARAKFQAINSQKNNHFYGPFSQLAMMKNFKTSIYIEDKGSHNQIHSLANRFYEMLSANLAILVDVNAVPIFEWSGLELHDSFIVERAKDVDDVVRHDYIGIRMFQAKHWRANYRRNLQNEFKNLIKEIL